jgi:hypothetical protein
VATLGELVTDIRFNLGEATARFYTNAELKSYVGEAYRHYVISMIEEGSGSFQTVVNLGFVSQVEEVSLAALNPAFFEVALLERRISNGTFPLRRKDRRYTINSSFNSSAGDSYLPTYKLRGLNIVLEPPPQSTEAASATTGLKLAYYYIPVFPTSATGDTFSFNADFPVIYEPMIELYATIAALEAKDGMGGVSDISSFRDRLASWDQRFMDSLNRSEDTDQIQYIGINYNNIF